MDLSVTSEYRVKAPKNIQKLSIGNGVMAEVAYQKQVVDYSVEFDTINYNHLVSLKNEV
jgi:hypothetical protein